MKKLFAFLLGAAILAAALPARADVGITDLGITNTIGTNVTITVNVGNAVRVNKNDNVGVMMYVAGNSDGATNTITYTWARSLDGTTYETNPRFTTTLMGNSVTPVANYTNLPAATIGAAQYIKLVSIRNNDDNMKFTNCSVKVITKSIKPSP